MRGERLILFLKDPGGRVKTRLAVQLGAALARETYRAMVADLLANLEPVQELIVPYLDPDGCAPGSPGAGCAGWDLPRRRLQRGADLGERMAGAFREVFGEGARRVLLIGSDIPQVDASLIRSYMRRLGRHDMVFGPAADGGYYLIGLRPGSLDRRLFQGISWSTERVYRQTLERARWLGLSCFSGPVLRDIDTLEDLLAVAAGQPRGRLAALAASLAGEKGAGRWPDTLTT